MTPDHDYEGNHYGSVTVTLGGSNFQSGSVVDWNGAPVTTQFVSGSELIAHIPNSDFNRGQIASITVVHPGGSSSNSVAFRVTVTIPIITGLSQSLAGLGGWPITLTVTGWGFFPGATVQFNGVPVTTTQTPDGKLQATIPTSLLSTMGTSHVNVTNPQDEVPSVGAPFIILNPLYYYVVEVYETVLNRYPSPNEVSPWVLRRVLAASRGRVLHGDSQPPAGPSQRIELGECAGGGNSDQRNSCRDYFG
jgi:hypothetical protein